MLDDDEALVIRRLRNRVTVDALRLFGEPFDVVRTVGDLTPCFGQRFALLRRQDLRKILEVFEHQREPLSQHRPAFLRGSCTPFLLRALCRFNGATCFSGAAFGNLCDRIAGRGIDYRKRISAIGVDPFAVNVGLSLQKTLV